MSARSNGQPLWLVRPIVDGVIREERGSVFAGTLAAMIEHIARLHRETGLQHAATEVQP
jgi:hypothetical protein